MALGLEGCVPLSAVLSIGCGTATRDVPRDWSDRVAANGAALRERTRRTLPISRDELLQLLEPVICNTPPAIYRSSAERTVRAKTIRIHRTEVHRPIVVDCSSSSSRAEFDHARTPETRVFCDSKASLKMGPYPCRDAIGMYAAVLSFAVATSAGAQSSLGTIRGTAWDPQRNVVPTATVTLVDEDAGISRAVEAGPTGNYEISSLKSGSYRLEASAPGFKTFERIGIALSAGDTIRVDITFQLGQPSEVVTVTAPLVQLESPAIESSVDASQLQTLPRNSRDFQSFLFLTNNVVGDPDNVVQFLGGRTYGVLYVQDGQPSSSGIFGNITNAAPGVDAISEVKVLSSSSTAEYGGLASVVVTTLRGGSRWSGTAFYDTNADELNALTYTQRSAGLRRGFPGSATSDHQFGITIGGPIKRNRTFLLASYEGLQRSSVGGGSIIAVPTDAMRTGDFSANTFVIRDPRTGQPFLGNVIPRDRIDPAAARVLEVFYPRANLAPLANGVGRNQQFVNFSATQQRWDARLDHELSSRDSVFGRVSWLGRDPGTALEDANLPNLGVQDRRVHTHTITATWRRTISRHIVHEMQAGYVSDGSNRRSHFDAADVTGALGLEMAPTAIGRRGYPAFTFQGSNAIRSVADPSVNANRNTRTSTITLSQKLTWLHGRHSMRFGGQYSRRSVQDGFSLGVTGAAGRYIFSGSATGNSSADFLLGLPASVEEGINTRGTQPLDASAKDFAIFAQDDWILGNALSLFLGVRYELSASFVERNDLLINFNPRTGALVLPTREVALFLSPEALALPLELAHEVGVGRALVRNDTNNIGPRVGFAYRPRSEANMVVRGGAGYFYPTSAAQGIRDALSRAAFRYARVRTNATLLRGFSTGTLSNRSLFGVNAVDLSLESAEAFQYHATLERELPLAIGVRVSYLGTHFRKLLVNRDLNTVPPSAVPFDPENPVDRFRLPYPNLDPFLNTIENAGTGSMHALQLEGRRRVQRGLAFTAAYTLARSESTAPDLGNSTLGVVQYAPYNLELDRGPDPNLVRHRFVLDAMWEVPFRWAQQSQAARSWAKALLGGWTVAAIVQARSGQHLTPYFRYGTDPIFPANTGKAYDTNNSFDEAWRPDVIGNPAGFGDKDNFFNLDAFRLPPPGEVGNARKGLLEGPGTWVVNLGLYKSIADVGHFRAELRATIDNAFNHPQFLVTSTSGFVDLTDFLVNGVRENGVTNTLKEVGSLEGFAPSRVVRLGLRMTF